MEFDLNGLEVIERDECLALLRSVPIGRIGMSMHALPVVLPVNFVVDGDEIVVRTAPGTKLGEAMAGSVVAFEADAFDDVSHSGWSVLVQGVSRVVTTPSELAHVASLPLRPWANAATDWYLAIGTDVVSGRRVRHWHHDGAHAAFVGAAAHADGGGRPAWSADQHAPDDGGGVGGRVDLDAPAASLGPNGEVS
ncbi:MAG: pyridoxamine 5'-phosphate oxidase family protein [Acidimicrobiales bacterium]|nr:pyridoxamine 5'-phosphate oxidase family protein [Acidimicrobiales bacterium]MCB1248335.1 pyridoxamine 5'-phosphate oxidase family protein [Acidimicrobiales bacterium]MCB1262174.1 pyridoxamine 5'-phosphate oxidase family protein [Acidimicrobiales bacterium]